MFYKRLRTISNLDCLCVYVCVCVHVPVCFVAADVIVIIPSPLNQPQALIIFTAITTVIIIAIMFFTSFFLSQFFFLSINTKSISLRQGKLLSAISGMAPMLLSCTNHVLLSRQRELVEQWHYFFSTFFPNFFL